MHCAFVDLNEVFSSPIASMRKRVCPKAVDMRPELETCFHLLSYVAHKAKKLFSYRENCFLSLLKNTQKKRTGFEKKETKMACIILAFIMKRAWRYIDARGLA